MVLTCDKVIRPTKSNDEIEVRPIIGDGEYEMAVELQVRSREPHFREEPYRGFRRARMAAYKDLVEEGKGQWYGAFLKGRLVGDLGLFNVGSLARYQFVSTDPLFRRQGICSTLMYETAKLALACEETKTLVIASDPQYHSTHIYKKHWFRVCTVASWNDEREKEVNLFGGALALLGVLLFAGVTCSLHAGLPSFIKRVDDEGDDLSRLSL